MSLHERFGSEIPDAPFDIGEPLESAEESRRRQKEILARARARRLHRLASKRKFSVPQQSDRGVWIAAGILILLVATVVLAIPAQVPVTVGW